MNRWLKRIRGAVGLGLTWGIAWAVAGILIGVASTLGVPMDWFMKVFDAPLPALAVPGFFCGATFSLVLGIAGRRHRFRELSLPRFASWGALGGLMLASVPLLAAGAPLGVAAIAAGTLTVLGAGSAAATLTLARKGEARELLAAVDGQAER